MLRRVLCFSYYIPLNITFLFRRNMNYMIVDRRKGIRKRNFNETWNVIIITILYLLHPRQLYKMDSKVKIWTLRNLDNQRFERFFCFTTFWKHINYDVYVYDSEVTTTQGRLSTLSKLILGDNEKYQLVNYGWSKYNVHDTFNAFLTKWLLKCAVWEVLSDIFCF